ncbi:DUF7289 family protein [Halovenus marina]|uniref:DUF7289 family protein n=1 Tax=Halovenus marina TaxID=3396621 RepID=UPI003F55BCEB
MGNSRNGTRDRGQSELLGVMLIFAVVLAGAIAVVSLGAVAIGDFEDGLSNDRAEKTMTQFASESALVALEGADSQRISLPKSSRESYRIDETAGTMNVTYHHENGDTEVVEEFTLGRVTYEGSDGTTVAYQGGGVWRSADEGGSVMVSPPEFHYRSATLTLPVITISGDQHLGSTAVIDRQSTSGVFPDESNSLFSNPLQNGQVNVTVTSEYYRGWGSYFEERTEGAVAYQHDENKVTVELVVPMTETFSNVIASTDPNGITANPGPKPEPFAEGVAYPSPDSRIEEVAEDCRLNGCDPIPTDGSPISDNGTYWIDGDYTGEINVDNPGGDVELLVNGTYNSEGMDITTSGSNVTLLVRGSLTLGGSDEINPGGPPEALRTLVHSDAPSVDFNGRVKYVGVLYAPENHCDFNGGPHDENFEGAIICETMDINGRPNDFQYRESVEDITLELNEETVTYLHFLHISQHDVSITSG